MGEISQFIAMPFDLTEDGLVAGEPCLAASVPKESGPRNRNGAEGGDNALLVG